MIHELAPVSSTRWLAGSFDPQGRDAPARLAQALEPHEAQLREHGPLRVAFSGPPAPGLGVAAAPDRLCLFDGYLDNAAELRRELVDTEAQQAPGSIEMLLAAGHRRWGLDLLTRLRGDFVLLLWDAQRSEGLIARDQLGVRPLFLHDADGPLRFAGEIRHLLALLPRRPAPDPVGVAHWIATSTRPGTGTLYSGIRRLGPGRVLLLDRDGAHEQRWWSPRFREPLAPVGEQLVAQTRAALELAARRRIEPEGRTAVLMSGGLDSSAVAALCVYAAGDRVVACSGTFPAHLAADESELIDELANRLALPRIGAAVNPGGVVASALEHLAAWEMPLLGWGDFWVLPLLRAAATDGARVVLGGNGGDELFGPRADLLADRLRAGHPLRALEVALRLPGASAGPPRRDIARMYAELGLGALPYRLHDTLRRRRAGHQLPGWLLAETARNVVESDDPLAWKRLDGPRWWARTAHTLTHTIEETGVFEHQRRRAELAGVQARHPLFDLDLVELGLRTPPQESLDPRFSRPVLRASTAGLLPDSVRLRPGKARFESLIADTLAGPDRAAVHALLGKSTAELGAYVDLPALRRALLDAPRPPLGDEFRWMWQVWRLTTAECWLRAQTSPASELLGPGAQPSKPRVAIHQPHAAGHRAPYVFPP